MNRVINFSQNSGSELDIVSVIPLYNFDGKKTSFDILDSLIRYEIEKRKSKEVIVVFYGTSEGIEACDLTPLTYLKQAKMIACLDDEKVAPEFKNLGLDVEFIAEGVYTGKMDLIFGFLNKEKAAEKEKDRYPYLYKDAVNSYLNMKTVAYPNVLFFTQPIWGLGDSKINSVDYVGNKGLNRIVRNVSTSLKAVFAPFFQPEQYRLIKFNTNSSNYQITKYYVHPYSLKNRKNNNTVVSFTKQKNAYTWETNIHVLKNKMEQEFENPSSAS